MNIEQPSSSTTIIENVFASYSGSSDFSKILADLGKATKRGIKKCPKCGVYNGTRGIICKNKECDALLKDNADKRQVSLDSVRLVGIVRQVYSVRVKDRGPDHRGFVQLPLTSSGVQNPDNASQNALCFVDSCQRQFDDSILKCHETEQNANTMSESCVHINSALKSQTTAVPIEVKNDILTTLKVSDEIKHKLLLLATEKEGPLVQRVSKTVMAVKCQVSPKHPLGYLHFTFLCTKGRETYDKYYCSCTEFMSTVNKSNNVKLKCVHYYACICALASDRKCSEEFGHFINYELPRKNLPAGLYEDDFKHVEENSALCSNIQSFESRLSVSMKPKTRITSNGVTHCPNNKRYKKYKKLAPKIFPVEIKVLDNEKIPNMADSMPHWNFLSWLSYVTESINQKMKFENYGKINTLIFSLPEVFYEEFENRIPTTYTLSSRTSKVFHVMSILHLKQIFDTPDVKLRISKRFVHDLSQNIYVEYDENDEMDPSKTTYIFFLNVGQSTIDETDNVNNAFVIEWLPNLATATKVGQLKFQYKFGRKRT